MICAGGLDKLGNFGSGGKTFVFRCAINDDVVFITAEVEDSDVVVGHISFCVTGVTKLSNVRLLCFPPDGASRRVTWMPICQQKQIFVTCSNKMSHMSINK